MVLVFTWQPFPARQIHHPVLWESAEDLGPSCARSWCSHHQQHRGHFGLQRSADRNLWLLSCRGSWADPRAVSGDTSWHLGQGSSASRALGTQLGWGQGQRAASLDGHQSAGQELLDGYRDPHRENIRKWADLQYLGTFEAFYVS